jgi:hypothetical protein
LLPFEAFRNFPRSFILTTALPQDASSQSNTEQYKKGWNNVHVLCNCI